MINIFCNTPLLDSTNSYIIYHRDMLHIFTQTYPPCMWTNRNTKFSSHQQDTQYFINPSYSATIYLTNTYGSAFQKLLKHNLVLTDLSGSHFNRSNCFGNSQMTDNIIGTGRFLYPQRIKLSEMLHILNSFIYIPILISIHHEHHIIANFFPNNLCSLYILLQI